MIRRRTRHVPIASISRKSALVYGYHGKQNFGDDLFVDVLERYGKRILDGRNPVFYRTIASEGGAAERLWRDLSGRTGAPAGLLRAAEFVLRATIVGRIAFCGGSLFSKWSGSHLLAFVLVKLRLCAVEAYGVSVGPFPADSWKKVIMMKLAAACSPMIVRDLSSQRLVSEELGRSATMGGDLAALSPYLKRVAQDQPASSNEAPGVSVYIPCSHAEPDAAIIRKRLREAFRNEQNIIILSVNSNASSGDDSLAASIARGLSRDFERVRSVAYSSVGIEGVCEIIASAQLVISARLHGAIAAYLLRVPFALVDYHQKCADFGETVGLARELLIGSHRDNSSWSEAVAHLSVNSASVVDLPPEVFVNRVEEAYLNV